MASEQMQTTVLHQNDADVRWMSTGAQRTLISASSEVAAAVIYQRQHVSTSSSVNPSKSTASDSTVNSLNRPSSSRSGVALSDKQGHYPEHRTDATDIYDVHRSLAPTELSAVFQSDLLAPQLVPIPVDTAITIQSHDVTESHSMRRDHPTDAIVSFHVGENVHLDLDDHGVFEPGRARRLGVDIRNRRGNGDDIAYDLELDEDALWSFGALSVVCCLSVVSSGVLFGLLVCC